MDEDPGHHVPDLDRQSNIKFFAKLATPHMVDTRRLELLKRAVPQQDDLEALPLGTGEPDGMSVQRDHDDLLSPPPDLASLLPAGRPFAPSSHARSTPPVHVPRPYSRSSHASYGSPSQRHSRAGSSDRGSGSHSLQRSPHARPPPWQELMRPTSPSLPRAEAAPSPEPAPARLDPRYETQEQTWHHQRERERELQRERERQQEAWQQEAWQHASELERMRHAAAAGPPARPRHGSPAYRARETAPRMQLSAPAASYRDMFREAMRDAAHGGGGSRTSGQGARDAMGGYDGRQDPDFHEKMELQLKLDELRDNGYNVPKLSLEMPLEDFQQQLHRRTISMNTVGLVHNISRGIYGAAAVIEFINNACGPFLPMQNYASRVREGCETPRFKYALYQIVVRFGGRRASSPWWVIVMVLLVPLIEGIVGKFVMWLAKRHPVTRSFNLQPGAVQGAVSSAMGMFTGGDPNKGVPNNIPGISPNLAESGASTNAPATSGGGAAAAGGGLGGLMGGLVNGLFGGGAPGANGGASGGGGGGPGLAAFAGAKSDDDAGGYKLPDFVRPSAPAAAPPPPTAAPPPPRTAPPPPGPPATAPRAPEAAPAASEAAKRRNRTVVRRPDQILRDNVSAVGGVPAGVIITPEQQTSGVLQAE